MTTASRREPLRDRLIRFVIAGAAAASLGWVAANAGGCQGHGKYTQEHVSGAKSKMNAMKAATEYNIAQQAFLAGDLKKALKHVDYSIGLNEKMAKTHVLRGRVLTEMGDVEKAALSLAKAEELDPKCVDAWYFQGVLAERIGRSEEALTRYRGAGELDPANAQYAIAAAEMLIELDRVDEAESYLTGRQEHFDHSAGVRQLLGHIAVLRDDYERAVLLFKEARLLAPDELTVLEDLARAQVAVGKLGDAETSLAKLLKTPDYATRRDLLHLRAECLVQLNRQVDARNIYIELTKNDEGANDLTAWIALGELSYELRDTARLREAASRVVALAPERAEGYVLRALAARRIGDFKAARAHLEKAVVIDAAPDTLVLLAMTYGDLGETDKAKICCTAALQRDPTHEAATEFLGRLDTTAVTNVPEKSVPGVEK